MILEKQMEYRQATQSLLRSTPI